MNPCMNVSIGLSFSDSMLVSNSLEFLKVCADLSSPSSRAMF